MKLLENQDPPLGVPGGPRDEFHWSFGFGDQELVVRTSTYFTKGKSEAYSLAAGILGQDPAEDLDLETLVGRKCLVYIENEKLKWIMAEAAIEITYAQRTGVITKNPPGATVTCEETGERHPVYNASFEGQNRPLTATGDQVSFAVKYNRHGEPYAAGVKLTGYCRRPLEDGFGPLMHRGVTLTNYPMNSPKHDWPQGPGTREYADNIKERQRYHRALVKESDNHAQI